MLSLIPIIVQNVIKINNKLAYKGFEDMIHKTNESAWSIREPEQPSQATHKEYLLF